MSEIPVLDVKLYGEKIGSLTFIDGGRSIFGFTEGYLNEPDRPTLSTFFRDEFGGLISDLPVTRTRLTPFFSNLLPEGHLRKYLADRAGVSPELEFFLIQALGRDLPGAVVVTSEKEESWPYENARNDLEAEKRNHANILRFSLAGVQLKFSAVHDKRAYRGLTIPAQGVGGSWIVKLPSASYAGIPENEFSMLSIARQIGIDVPETDLIDVNDIDGLPGDTGDMQGNAFAIKRFDRSEDGPIHIEDFAQVFGVYPEKKYEKASYRNILEFLAAQSGEDSVVEFIRRLTFSVLIGNADMHLKNWSLIYPDRKKPNLSPAYDFVSTIPYIEDDGMALKFARANRFKDFTIDEVSYLAAKAGVPQKVAIDTTKETVERFLETWSAEKSQLPMEKRVMDKIDAHLGRLPITR